MLFTAPCDVKVLTTFVQNSESVPARDVADAIQRIITTLSKSESVPKETVKVAQHALATLFQAPNPDIIPSLLPVCQLDVSSQAVDMFVLCTAAWKALSAAVVHSVPLQTVSSPIVFQVIASATNASCTMLLRGVAFSNVADSSGKNGVGRCVKIAKFYALHATRCTKAFVAATSNDKSFLDDSNAQSFTDLFGSVLRLTGLLSFVLCHNNSHLISVREELVSSLAPPVTSLMSSTISMLCPCLEREKSLQAINVFSNALKSFSNESFFKLDNSMACPPSLLQLFATLHVMRYVASKCSMPIHNQTDSGRKDDVLRLRHIFKRNLCPPFFTALDGCYNEVVSVRVESSPVPLLSTVASSAAECFSKIDVCGINSVEQSATRLRDSLLIEMSAVNPARAFVASEGLIRIFFKLVTDPDRSVERFELLSKILRCCRMAFAMQSAHADSRWLRLAARCGVLSLQDEGLLLRAVKSSRMRTLPNDDSGVIFNLHDVFLLRLVHAMYRHTLLSKDEGNDAQASSFLTVSKVLECLQMKLPEVQALVTACLQGDNCNYEVTQCSLALASCVLDDASASNIVATFLLHKGQELSSFCVGLHAIQPLLLDADRLNGVVTEARNYVKQYGVVVCVPAAAFVLRAVKKGGKRSEQMTAEMLRLLRLTVEKVMSTGGNEKQRVVENALSGTVLYLAAEALSLIGSTVSQCGGVDVSKILGDQVLREIEKAQERKMELTQRIDSGVEDDWLNASKERAQIEAEKAACGGGGGGGGNQKMENLVLQHQACNSVNTELGAAQSARESLLRLLGMIVRGQLPGSGLSEKRQEGIMGELEELQNLLHCVELWCLNGALRSQGTKRSEGNDGL